MTDGDQMPNSLAELLSDKQRKKLYFLPEFIAYFEAVYAAIDNENIDERDYKKVITEMYPLSKICADLLREGIDREEVEVQYVDDKSVDAKIFGLKNSEPVFIELTTAADNRRHKLVIESLSTGKLMSFSGNILEDNLEGSQRQGYDFNGREVEGEFDDDTLARLSTLILKRIENKLSASWANKDYWLCVIIDDITNWNNSIQDGIGAFLTETGLKYHEQLRSKNVRQVYLTGYRQGIDSWIYKYPIISKI